MILISKNSYLFLIVIIAIILLLLYFNYNIKKLKAIEKNRLKAIFSEIEIEKNNQLHLKKVPKKIQKIEFKRKATFRKISVQIFNIDFSYKEILSNI